MKLARILPIDAQKQRPGHPPAHFFSNRISARLPPRSLAFTTVEPGERHCGPAATAVVLDQQPRADALHPHLASASVVAAVVFKGHRVSLWGDMRLEGAVVEIARGGKEYAGVNVQLAPLLRLDLDMTAAHVALALSPKAGPVGCLRRRHRRNRPQCHARQPSGDPG